MRLGVVLAAMAVAATAGPAGATDWKFSVTRGEGAGCRLMAKGEGSRADPRAGTITVEYAKGLTAVVVDRIGPDTNIRIENRRSPPNYVTPRMFDDDSAVFVAHDDIYEALKRYTARIDLNSRGKEPSWGVTVGPENFGAIDAYAACVASLKR